MRLLVGLGNPGAQYDKTRHNLGFKLVDALAAQLGGVKWKNFKGGESAQVQVGGEKVLLFKPMQFMNTSGIPIRAVMDYYQIPAAEVCICADDVYITPGSARIRKSGGDGGHNGWKSVIAHLEPDIFWRVKVGAGLYEQHPEKRVHQPPLDEYVLQPLPKQSQKSAEHMIDILVPKLLYWLEQGELTEETLHI